MNFPRVFVDRPIFAVVPSVLVLVAGLLSMLNLPVSEYAPRLAARRPAHAGAEVAI